MQSRNEPAFVVETARRIAELRNDSYYSVAQAAARNFADLFRVTSLP
ncbi:MAG: hypothetical protein R2762_15965 [Bryobacteraceae bacterium]